MEYDYKDFNTDAVEMKTSPGFYRPMKKSRSRVNTLSMSLESAPT